jgi:hypothetical protein
MVSNTNKIIRQFKQQTGRAPREDRTPIATGMYLPNHSGVTNHPEFQNKISEYVPYIGANKSVNIGTQSFFQGGSNFLAISGGKIYFYDGTERAYGFILDQVDTTAARFINNWEDESAFSFGAAGNLINVSVSGKVGIGTTTPGEKLTVHGNISIREDDVLKLNTYNLWHNVSTTGESLAIQKTGLDGYQTITRVGLFPPTYGATRAVTLDLYDQSDPTSPNYARLRLLNTPGTGHFIQGDKSGTGVAVPLTLKTADTSNQLVLAASGKVGIGRSPTTHALEVSGEIQPTTNYRSSDGTAGLTTCQNWVDAGGYTHSVVIKNGLITYWSKC